MDSSHYLTCPKSKNNALNNYYQLTLIINIAKHIEYIKIISMI